MAPAPALATTVGSGKQPRAMFALIIGVNTSPDRDLAALKYADDDAARYLDLFRALGARTYLLSRPDANTRRLHPQAAAESLPPRQAELRQAIGALAGDINQARARGVPSTLYVVYAGHGDVQDAAWYLTLEDARLSGPQLMSDVVDRAAADRTHVIIDACHAYLLALPRGPGGTQRPLHGFVELEAASRAGRVGFLLSSSVSGESHEWAGFEAGVFSHEVRSGLYGAADADGDGQVTYAEIGAFVARANEAITNERYRPQVLARAPRGGDLLLDLRGGGAGERRGLMMDASDNGTHYLLENGDGVRLLDFHATAKVAVQLVRPPGEGPLYLRRLADQTEWTIPRRDGVVRMEQAFITAARTQSRGAAHHAFSKIFTLAFDNDAVDVWTRRSAALEARVAEAETTRDLEARRKRWRRIAGTAALGLGVAAAVSAVAVELSAHKLRDEAPAGENQRDAFARNERIDFRNFSATALATGALLASAGGLLLWLWPERRPAPPEFDLAISAGGGGGGELEARWHF